MIKEKEKLMASETYTLDVEKIKSKEVKLHFLYYSVIFALFVLIVLVYICLIPGFSIESKNNLRTLIPKSFKDIINLQNKEKVRILYDSLISYKNEHELVLLLLLSLLYILYQSFPIFLWWMAGTGCVITILIGAFYNYIFSILYCSILATLAPFITYVIFKYYGRTVINYFFQKQLIKFNRELNKRVRNNVDLFVYVTILRLTPVFPNVVINLVGACVQLPAVPFFLATYIGILPNTIILVSVGQAINSISSVNMTNQFYMSITFIVLLLLFQTVINYKCKDMRIQTR
ncbi:SNARE associated Golgi protein, putative [Plasmodium malariae]|uniref:SNARE associated Golgi protein, putative n=1 Tax=Plasmodium malariae TaxID=5858 RepID=A0A1D3SN46_PLAMA|nr:SNARE associated Golgi protein, putative [Plasmodium malariae]SCO93268.1 SNARE associated Golgi protein, putative [Plasmodium malariae]